MDCLRCHGMMVGERFEDVRADPRDMSFHGWRCVCCGNIDDPVIAVNRVRPPASRHNEALRNILVPGVAAHWDLEAA
jgi:hypothetical protein